MTTAVSAHAESGVRYYRSSLTAGPRPECGTDLFAGSFASPLALIRQSALDSNIRQMQQWCDEHGVQLAPHGKTTLSPPVFVRQLKGGAWGMTVASPAQARVALDSGARRILIANEVTDSAGIKWLGTALAQNPDLSLWCCVDSLAGVALLNSRLENLLPEGVTLGILIELGVPGGRTGLRDVDSALQVARAVSSSARLRLAGVSGYEGVVGGQATPQGLAAVEDFCLRLSQFASTLAHSELVDATPERPMIISAGGSVFFDQVAAILGRSGERHGLSTIVVLRSGCYVTHDHGRYARLTPAARGGDGPDLRPALEVWGRVLSRPEPSRAIVDVGRRDLSYDYELPQVLSRKLAAGGSSLALSATVSKLNDQHAFLDLSASTQLEVGDWVGFGISHPCTTFDKWNILLLADDQDHLIEELPTFF
jgi:D-serine deaminase-like pyridoxal phosphate-dependent protein